MSVSLAQTGPERVREPHCGKQADRYRAVRGETESLSSGLTPEDQTLQSMSDASPAKWHRAHTTWFFETFVLKPHLPGYVEYDPAYNYLFNSYYDAVGERHARERRGLLSRPAAEEVSLYRAHVDRAMEELLEDAAPQPHVAALVELGLQHEQQHQELLLTDILHAFAQNPLLPAYAPYRPGEAQSVAPPEFVTFAVERVPIGHTGEGFAFDNEMPRHDAILPPYMLADRLVTNEEWIGFIDDGGYRKPALWLADGWQRARAEGWEAPLYWERRDGAWFAFTLSGLRPVDAQAPVCHVSYYEADAFARWSGNRLPSEAEWEFAASQENASTGNFRDSGYFRPLARNARSGRQMFGDVWDWTQSAYAPYPGYRTPDGAIGEYNGKFMINQMVLRGGSCATARDHIRASYRNFFYPHQRWQFAGVRLARDVSPSPRRLARNGFLEDVWQGLARNPKSIPSKYFYDAAGSALYEQICELPEYYPTRTESRLLLRIAPELQARGAGQTTLVEFGCGASLKTRILLDRLSALRCYVPVDICEESLQESTRRIERDYPKIAVRPLAHDFLDRLPPLPAPRDGTNLGFFPGSTIGNLSDREAENFLRDIRVWLGDGAQFLIGIDLVKDIDVLLRAYDDPAGITAQFNRNLLVRMNRELGADFDPDGFSHRALWNAAKSRIEMHLVSQRSQTVSVRDRTFRLDEGETIHTENSRKYTIAQFAVLAARAGWRLARSWSCPDPAFGIVLLN